MQLYSMSNIQTLFVRLYGFGHKALVSKDVGLDSRSGFDMGPRVDVVLLVPQCWLTDGRVPLVCPHVIYLPLLDEPADGEQTHPVLVWPQP